MRVLFLTSGEFIPSSRYRIHPYLSHLRSQGIECDVSHSIPPKYHRFPWLGWRLSHLIRKGIRTVQFRRSNLRRYDVVVLEREIFDDPTWNYEALLRSRIPRLILDIDDAIFLRYPEKFARIAGMSDHILAGNRLLAQECLKHSPHVTVIPTAIDLNDYPPLPERTVQEIPVIGWIGTTANLPYLNVAIPALKKVFETHRFLFRVITSDDQDLKKLDFGSIPVEFRRWSAPAAVHEIQQFHIGIMPLPDEPWERYKCGFKLLQYMASGVPAIASPVGVNREIISHGINGLLAETSEDWYDSLKLILTNPDRGSSLREAARDTIEVRYSVDLQFPLILNAIMGEERVAPL
ncbi:MAG TPA: glycosyltransferase family 4 protein [Planctomicrobium sp.]|nr:glycosyltransferase family 4 protein [Planctomicrobium sp.]